MELHDVSFRYERSKIPSLRGVNLSVRAGEFVVVMGPSGAGKTTLAKCINRTVPAFHPGDLQGEVIINGHRLGNEGVADLAGMVGFVSQDFESQLFATNAVQEIAFGMEQLGVPHDEMERRANSALVAVGLEGSGERDPATLSGGEKQRLAVAAVLAMRPRILVFDEPTTDLDPEGKIQVFDVLAALRRQGFTIVLIEHEIQAAERADRIILMDGGRVVADEPPGHLLLQIDRLHALGIRPADLDRVAHVLGKTSRFRSLEEAIAEVSPRLSPPAAKPIADGTGNVLLETVGLGQNYESSKWALSEVSFQLRAGEFVAIIGQNGSGKSTFAKHLNGLLRPSAGVVRLRGCDLSDLSLVDVAREVAYVFQDPDQQIFASMVCEEVAFGLRNAGLEGSDLELRVAEALAAVGLQGFEQADPFLLGKGHRQQLAVASLLALRPRILILDEPTTGLDYQEQRRMLELLRCLHEAGMAIVVITHTPWVVADYARRGVLMRDGRIVFDGPLPELFAEQELLSGCRFRIPDIIRIGLSCGRTLLTFDELSSAIRCEAKL